MATDPTPQTTPTRDEAVLYARYEPEWGRMMLCNRDHFGAVEYRLASAPAPASGGVDAVAVKALEWRHVDVEWFEASTPLGMYEVSNVGWSFEPNLKRRYSESSSVEEAKAAAEADYEQRIRSALSPAATPVSEAGGEAIAFITKLVHMQSGQGWSRAVVRDAAANFLKLHGIAITGHADTTAEIAALAKPGDDDIPTPIRIEDNLDIAMNEFWNAPGGTQGGVRAVLEWVNAVYFPKEGFVRVEHEHAGGAEP